MFYQNIVTRNNIVWKLARGYCLCYCKTFSLVPDSTECTIFLQRSAVHYSYHLKSNIIGQRKTNLKLSCTQLILVNSKLTSKFSNFVHLLYKNWLRVISCQEQINRLMVVIHHETIHELASLRFLKLNLECQNIKMGRRTYEHLFFFFHETMF